MLSQLSLQLQSRLISKKMTAHCHSFRTVWAAHMQMLVLLTFTDLVGIEGRNGQSQTAKAGKIASDVTSVFPRM